MEIKELLARNLRIIRERLGFSQSEVAGVLDISQPAYSKYENNEIVPSAEVIKKLANLFNVDEYTFYESNSENFTADLAFAFKADEIDTDDLKQIAKFNKIVRNYLNMCHELEKD